jgi:hypothetical protein
MYTYIQIYVYIYVCIYVYVHIYTAETLFGGEGWARCIDGETDTTAPNPPAGFDAGSERPSGHNLKRLTDFHLKDQARIWP